MGRPWASNTQQLRPTRSQAKGLQFRRCARMLSYPRFSDFAVSFDSSTTIGDCTSHSKRPVGEKVPMVKDVSSLYYLTLSDEPGGVY